MLKILKARLQQYVNKKFPNVQAWFRKGRRTRHQIANIHLITEKARGFQKSIYFCFIDYAKAFDCVSSVQFSHSVMSNSLRPHGLQHVRLPCQSPAPGTCSNSCPLSQWCHPNISSFVDPSALAFYLSQHQGLFQWVCIKWPKYWSFSFSFNVSPSNEYSGLISFKMDWFDLLAVRGTLKSLLQHHSSKASVLWCSALFMVQLSHPQMTTGKTIALARQTFVGRVMSLFFHMLSRLAITFLPRSKHLLNSWLQLPSAVILEPQKAPKIKKYLTASVVSPSICDKVIGPDAIILAFWMLSFKPAFSLSLSSRGS